jgi:hypothetical protein
MAPNADLKKALLLSNASNIPQAFLCPLTWEVMRDPVVDSNGHTYDRSAIEHWLQTNKRSPLTNTLLRRSRLKPNHALKDAIDGWISGQWVRAEENALQVPVYRLDWDLMWCVLIVCQVVGVILLKDPFEVTFYVALALFQLKLAREIWRLKRHPCDQEGAWLFTWFF